MLRRRSGDVPAHVQASLRCALDRDPASRFDTLAAFADALTRPGVPLPVRTKPRIALARSIAVLPFSDRSATADGEFLGDGIAEDLIGALSRLEGVRVVARGSAFAFKESTKDPKDIAAELGVDAVLTGTVRRHGTRLRISADLVEGGTGYALWSDRYDRELTDVFDVQDEITRAILARLSAQLLGVGRRLIEAPTANIDAYQAYLRGRFEWNERTEAGLQRAVEHHSTAVALDPSFALAHAGLADARLLLVVYGLRAPHDVLADAAHDADHALALVPDLAEALTARASVRAFRARDWAGAERDYAAALDSREAYATAHQWWAMHLLAPLGRFAEARVRLGRARELDGLSPAIATSAGLLRYFERDHPQAVAEFDLVLGTHARFGLAHLGRGLALSALGAHEEALAALERAHLLMGHSPEAGAALGVAFAAAGQSGAAKEQLYELDELAASRYVSPVLTAQVAAALGDTARALSALDDAHAAGAAELALIGVRPEFDALRGLPRFEAIRRALQV
jgi:serine/threonine-protein kinase